MEEAEKFLKIKRRLADIYRENLSGISGLELPIEEDYARRLYWHYEVRLKDRNKLADVLANNGVETRKFFVPMHQQPGCKRQGMFAGEKYPVAEKLSKRGLCLPSGLALKESEVVYICGIIKRFMKE